MYKREVSPRPPASGWAAEMQHQLEALGCIAHPHSASQLEIWEANLHEHYLVTVVWQPDLKLDIIQLS